MEKNLYVVTDVEGGWSCLVGLYKANNEDEVYQHLADEQEITVEELKRTYVVHEQYNIIEL